MRITSDKFIKDFAQTGLIESMINNLIANVFESIARQIITAAKNDGNYQNQTGNLRNSFGFIILKGEKVVMASFQDFDKLKEMRNINYKLPPMTPEEYISNATQNIISRIDTTNEKWQLVVFSAAYYALFVDRKSTRLNSSH